VNFATTKISSQDLQVSAKIFKIKIWKLG